ncbi:MAG: FkbM family methyltransferase, partial [Thermoplasmatales archaeon]
MKSHLEVNVISHTRSSFTLEYQTYGHFQGIIENYLFDVYRTREYRKGDVVVDVGAGIGDFSILAANAVGENGKVLAIEPSTRNFNLLKKNLVKNNIKNVIIYNYAVSDSSEITTIQFHDEKY